MSTPARGLEAGSMTKLDGLSLKKVLEYTLGRELLGRSHQLLEVTYDRQTEYTTTVCLALPKGQTRII